MPTTSAVSGSASSQATTSVGNAFDTFTSEDFLKVMFTELTKQDPTKPNDSKALLEQIGTIRSIESDLQLTAKLKEMAQQNQVTVAGSLLGKFAEGKTSSGTTVRGFVDSVSVTREGAILNLSTGFSIPMDRLERVIDPEIIREEPPTTPAPTTPAPTTPTPTTPSSTKRPDPASPANNNPLTPTRRGL